jgi:hypothetical protein
VPDTDRGVDYNGRGARRLYISGDTIKKSEVSDSEDNEASADEPAFKKVFEEDDGYVGFMIWKLSW